MMLISVFRNPLFTPWYVACTQRVPRTWSEGVLVWSKVACHELGYFDFLSFRVMIGSIYGSDLFGNWPGRPDEDFARRSISSGAQANLRFEPDCVCLKIVSFDAYFLSQVSLRILSRELFK